MLVASQVLMWQVHTGRYIRSDTSQPPSFPSHKHHTSPVKPDTQLWRPEMIPMHNPFVHLLGTALTDASVMQLAALPKLKRIGLVKWAVISLHKHTKVCTYFLLNGSSYCYSNSLTDVGSALVVRVGSNLFALTFKVETSFPYSLDFLYSLNFLEVAIGGKARTRTPGCADTLPCDAPDLCALDAPHERRCIGSPA
jgi:hypothetical protein